MRRTLLFLLTMAGCQDPEPPSSTVCPRPSAAFDVRLTAQGGEVAEGTRLSVTYGGATNEAYEVGEAAVTHEILCCVEGDGDGVSLAPATCGVPLMADASAATARSVVELVRCVIWTNGAADVLVVSSGYWPLRETLEARVDAKYPECDAWDTVEVELQLMYPEAGLAHAP